MKMYDFAEWTAWPVEAIDRYASEIAEHFQIGGMRCRRLMDLMRGHADRPLRAPTRIYNFPQKMRDEEVSLRRSFDKDQFNEFEWNQKTNKPSVAYKLTSKEKQMVWAYEEFGSGLTKRTFTHLVDGPSLFIEEERKSRKRFARKPFSVVRRRTRSDIEFALWRANCYDLGLEEWYVPPEHRRPFEGIWWYAEEIERMFQNAGMQAQNGNIEGAMYHAFNAGRLSAEVALRIAHADFFDKQRSVVDAQKQAGLSRKVVSDEERRQAWHHFKNLGDKNTEAGRSAARSLGLSEASIRAAFGGRYPK